MHHIFCVLAHIACVCFCTHMCTSCKKWHIYIYICIHICIYMYMYIYGASHYWMLRCMCVFIYIIYSVCLRVSGLAHMCAFAHICALRVRSHTFIYIYIYIYILMSGHPPFECYGVCACLCISHILRFCASQAYYICVRLHTRVNFVNI